ncbi:uncharacterized protein [Oscarella lobularis]|uniref:uncharacterized protein isoform X2 n=1 Tax=Oscarella lobularis TaxID=121494 RepID=UPI003313EE87
MGCGSSRSSVSPWPQPGAPSPRARKRPLLVAWQRAVNEKPKQARFDASPRTSEDSGYEAKDRIHAATTTTTKKADDSSPFFVFPRPPRIRRASSASAIAVDIELPAKLPSGLGKSRSVHSIRSYHQKRSESSSSTPVVVPRSPSTVSRAVLKECIAVALAGVGDVSTTTLPSPPSMQSLTASRLSDDGGNLLSPAPPIVGLMSRISVSPKSGGGRAEIEDMVDQMLIDVGKSDKKRTSAGSAVSMLVMRPSLVAGFGMPSSLKQMSEAEAVEMAKRKELEMSEIGLSEELVTSFELYNHMNAGVLNAYLSDPFYVLLLDARSDEAYRRAHINTARWYKEVTMDMRFLIDAHSYMDQYSLVVIYDEDGSPADDESSGMQLLKQLEGLGLERVSFLLGGFESFHQDFSFLCGSKIHWSDEDREKIESYPSSIIAGKLYQGNCEHARSETVFMDLGISHVVNVSSEHRNSFERRAKYLKISVLDERESSLLEYFEKTTDFLLDAFRVGGTAFVHCTRGVSRSSSITIALLMKRYNWTLGTAFEFLKDRRPGIRPNRSFLEQLSKWEKRIHGQATTDIDDLW